MARPRKLNKVPKTTISISDELWEIIQKHKHARETFNDVLSRIIQEWIYDKEHLPYVEDAYDKASRKIEQYVARISVLESKML